MDADARHLPASLARPAGREATVGGTARALLIATRRSAVRTVLMRSPRKRARGRVPASILKRAPDYMTLNFFCLRIPAQTGLALGVSPDDTLDSSLLHVSL